MTNYEIITGSAAVAGLAEYLWLKHRQRLPRSYNTDEWTGTALDVTPLKPVVESVRRDYLAAARHPAKEIFLHKRLIELARQTIARLAYFHHAESQEHTPLAWPLEARSKFTPDLINISSGRKKPCPPHAQRAGFP